MTVPPTALFFPKVEIADKIHNDPRDLSSEDAGRILTEIDKLFAHHAEFVMRTTVSR